MIILFLFALVVLNHISSSHFLINAVIPFYFYYPIIYSHISLTSPTIHPHYLKKELKKAITVCMFWSAFLLFFLSVRIAFHTNESVFEVLAEHMAISALVVFLSNTIGNLISEIFDDDKLIDDDSNGGQKEK